MIYQVQKNGIIYFDKIKRKKSKKYWWLLRILDLLHDSNLVVTQRI